MKLLIGNKNYSSWSMRPWLVLTHFGISFDEELFQLDGEGWREAIRARSPSGRVPVLVDGDLVVPETIAIIEYLADRFPDRGIWPGDLKQRALARSAAAEMHAGFSALRNEAPMNLRASHPGRVPLEKVRADLDRLDSLWSGLLDASGGPFLFGAFGGADAMFAPMATRLVTYELPRTPAMAAYVAGLHDLPAFREWREAALAEPWTVEYDEIDYVQGVGRWATD